jgi:hypothetical protein
VRLSAERIDVAEGERIRAVLIVSTPIVSVLTLGGLDRLRHELEDIGFHDVQLFAARPAAWLFAPDVPQPDELEWLLFAELVPVSTASLRRELTDELRVATAWDARLDGEPALPFHPYAVDFCAAARFAGVVRAYATAYRLEAH